MTHGLAGWFCKQRLDGLCIRSEACVSDLPDNHQELLPSRDFCCRSWEHPLRFGCLASARPQPPPPPPPARPRSDSNSGTTVSEACETNGNGRASSSLKVSETSLDKRRVCFKHVTPELSGLIITKLSGFSKCKCQCPALMGSAIASCDVCGQNCVVEFLVVRSS